MGSYNCPLPEEIITDILSRLPAVSAVSLKQVCRTWRKLLVGPNFARIHLRRHQQSVDRDVHGSYTGGCDKSKVNFLCLQSQRSTESPCENSIYYREYFEDKLNKLWKKKLNLNFLGSIIGSCNGLICMFSNYEVNSIKYRRLINIYGDPTCIFNPITGEDLNLPKLFIHDTFDVDILMLASGFGYLPSTDEYKVVRIYYGWKDQTTLGKVGKVQVYTLGNRSNNNSGQWRDICEIPYKLGNSNGVFVNGTLHWLEYNLGVRIIAFDLVTEEVYVVKPQPNCFEVDSANNYNLGVLGGRLGVYHRKYTCWDLWVLKKTKRDIMEEKGEYYDDSSWSWSRIFSIREADLRYDDCEPFAVTNGGEILFTSYLRSALCVYNPKTATFKITSCLTNRDRREYTSSIVHHVNTFISLKGMA